MTTTPRSKPSARERILQAATDRFSQNSYEQTSLRAIAADADVDVAYVHRCFGSKERLLAEAIGDTTDLTDLVAKEAATIAASLAERALSVEDSQSQPLGIFIHAITSPDARPILRQFLLEKMIEPISTQIDDATGRRAALAMALLAGVALFRTVLRVEPLIEADRQELKALLTHVLAVTLDGTHETTSS